MLITIDVTDPDIDSSGHCSYTCMVAMALKKYLDPAYLIGVGFSTAVIHKPNMELWMDTIYFPSWVEDKIFEFDSWDRNRAMVKNRPETFSFQCDIPAQYLKMEVPRGVVVLA